MSIEKRLERVEAILDARGLDWDHPRVEEDHFAGANKMVVEGPDNLRISIARELEGYRLVSDSDIGKVVEVQNSTADPWRECTLLAIDWGRRDGFLCRHSDPLVALRWRFARIKIDEPAKEPEHPAGPMPDPGKGYRILSKEPPEDLQPGDDYDVAGVWVTSEHARTHKIQHENTWYRRKIEQPEPAWEPKVGDWARVTRPENWEKCWPPCWLAEMHQFDGKVGQVERGQESGIRIRGFVGSDGLPYQFHRDWLTPAEPPAKEEPPKDEYREPVLPADLGKWAEFSHDGINWMRCKLRGCHKFEASLTIWSEKNIGFRHCRIKVDA